MKRILLFTLVIGLFAVQADAGLWELDKTTALQFQNISVAIPDLVGDLGVYDSWSSLYYTTGTSASNYGAYDSSNNPLMSGEVGFVASLTDSGTAPGHPDAIAIATISAGSDAGLTGNTNYSGLTAYFQNDNDDIWNARLFYQDDDGTHYSSWTSLAGGGGSTYLTASDGDGFTFNEIVDIGFQVKANFSGGDYPSSPDAFHISVVPVPAAVILGILGLGVAGIKLRKFA